MTELERCRAALALIDEWAGWHTDDTAELENKCPVDMVAHMNGLIRQRCTMALGITRGKRRCLPRAEDEAAAQLVKRLLAYNNWRRSGDGDQPDPRTIGADIDAAVMLISAGIQRGT